LARILIVHDDPQVLGLLSTLLRNASHEVQTASHASQAREIRTRLMPLDLVIADAKIPGMDVYEWTSWITAHSPGCRFLLLCAAGGEGVDRPLPPGCECVPKPFDPHELVRRVADRPELRRAVADSETIRCLERQLRDAQEALDRTSDQLRRLALLESDEDIADDVALLQEEVKRLRNAALEIHLIVHQRYQELLERRQGSGNLPEA